MPTKHEVALEDWNDAVAVVAKYFGTTAYQLRRDFRIRLLNARSGKQEFSRLVGDQTEYETLRECEYGQVMSPQQVGKGNARFIEVRPELWESEYDLEPIRKAWLPGM